MSLQFVNTQLPQKCAKNGDSPRMARSEFVFADSGGFDTWASGCEITAYTRGFAFDGSHLLSDSAALARHVASEMIGLAEEDRPAAFRKIVGRLNGNFALAVRAGDTVLAAVDRMRSIPLFYAVSNGRLVLGGDARTVVKQVGARQCDDVVFKEFLLTGFVTGAQTLDEGIRQLRAGEAFVARHTDRWTVTPCRYYRYVHGDLFNQPAEELYAPARNMLDHVFDRLVRSVAGRQIVVPLSGGRDSRLIVAMLKTMGIEDVVCFSYGRPGNWESEISRRVARRLGYRWEFVRESRRKWRRWHQTEECKAYYRYAHNFVSNVVLQHWPATWELRKAGRIAHDAVIVPGHSGDFLGGSHIPTGYADAERIGIDVLADFLMQKHYSLWDWSRTRDQLASRFRARILSSLEGMSAETPEEAADALEFWDWQERQAKFIVNDVRAYEFWGHEWRVPLWDNEMMAFFSRLPLRQRVGKAFYDAFLDNTLFSELGIRSFADVNIPGRLRPLPVRDLRGRVRPARLLLRAPNLIRRRLRARPDLAISSHADTVRCKRFYKRHFGAKSLMILCPISIDTHTAYHTLQHTAGDGARRLKGPGLDGKPVEGETSCPTC